MSDIHRSAAWARIRAAALRIQPSCIVCGSQESLEVDHHPPLAEGGNLRGPLAVLDVQHHLALAAWRREYARRGHVPGRPSPIAGREHLLITVDDSNTMPRRGGRAPEVEGDDWMPVFA